VEVYELEETIATILRGARKLFAILVMIHHEAIIVDFMTKDQLQASWLDARLPFSQLELETIIPDAAEEFYENQWLFTAPILSRRFHHRDLAPDTILPFVKSDYLGAGAFGQMYKVVLHPHHQKLGYLAKDGVRSSLT
jgi:hypothetical protein